MSDNNQETQIDLAERYKQVSAEYCKEMVMFVDTISSELEEVCKHMDMNDPYHADALCSFTWGLIFRVEKELKGIGKDYEIKVRNLKDCAHADGK